MLTVQYSAAFYQFANELYNQPQFLAEFFFFFLLHRIKQEFLCHPMSKSIYPPAFVAIFSAFLQLQWTMTPFI